MSSTERSSTIATSSIFIPTWVKNKLDNSGFDPSTLSPPTHDGEFFYVKFPKSEKAEPKQYPSINEVIREKEQAFANHTTACKKFIPIIQDTVPVIKPKIIKPMGVDDGFKGDDTACGASVVAVAQQMISGKPPVRGFTTDDASEKPSSNYLRQRRNSRSLPASPLSTPETSPRTRRKNANAFALQNKVNLGSIAATSLNEGEESALGKKSRSSWILSSLFSQSKESGLTAKNQDNSVAAEERAKGLTDKGDSSGLNLANLNVTVEVQPQTDLRSAPPPDKRVYIKKRSEIRELNFISPVSM